MLESYFNLPFHSYFQISSIIVQTANSKYESWWKLLMEVYQWINMIISVIQFPNVTLCFAWSYFNLPFHSYFQISSIIVQTANSKYGSWWKLLMEVYQWINMIIMVVQFPRVTFCFAWKLFQLAISLLFSNFINYCTNCKFKVRKLVKAINGSVSMD